MPGKFSMICIGGADRPQFILQKIHLFQRENLRSYAIYI